MIVAKTSVRVVYNPPEKDVDFSKIKFHPHWMPSLCTQKKPFGKKLYQVYEEVTTGRREVIQTDAVIQGIEREQDSIDIVNSKFGTMFQKNTTRFTNDWYTGEPDIIDAPNDLIIDIKTSGSPEAFDNLTWSSFTRYLPQGIAYCDLLEYSIFEVIFVNLTGNKIKKMTFNITPEMIQAQRRRVEFMRGVMRGWNDPQSLDKIKRI